MRIIMYMGPLRRSLAHYSTPLPTPTHKYNEWVSGRKSLGLTPQNQPGKEGETAAAAGGGGEREPMQFTSEADREEWEAEQKVLHVEFSSGV